MVSVFQSNFGLKLTESFLVNIGIELFLWWISWSSVQVSTGFNSGFNLCRPVVDFDIPQIDVAYILSCCCSRRQNNLLIVSRFFKKKGDILRILFLHNFTHHERWQCTQHVEKTYLQTLKKNRSVIFNICQMVYKRIITRMQCFICLINLNSFATHGF